MSKFQYQGRAFIRWNGREFPTLEGATFTPGGEIRDPVVGSRAYGYKTTVTHAEISCTIAHGNDISLFDIKNTVDATIEFESDSGQRFLMSNAWCDGRCSLSGGGDISAVFQAVEAKSI